MAADHHLPAFLVKTHARFGTPHRILWLYAAIYSVVALLPFEDLLVVDIWLYGATNVVLQFSLIRSRSEAKDEPATYLVPGGKFGLWLNLLVPTATWVLLLVFTAREHLALGGGMILAGPLLYLGERALRRPRG